MTLVPNKRYEVELIEQDGSRSFVRGISSSVDGNLLTLTVNGSERVFNTASSVFVGVTEWRQPDQDSKFKAINAPSRVYLDDEPTA